MSDKRVLPYAVIIAHIAVVTECFLYILSRKIKKSKKKSWVCDRKRKKSRELAAFALAFFLSFYYILLYEWVIIVNSSYISLVSS